MYSDHRLIVSTEIECIRNKIAVLAGETDSNEIGVHEDYIKGYQMPQYPNNCLYSPLLVFILTHTDRIFHFYTPWKP